MMLSKLNGSFQVMICNVILQKYHEKMSRFLVGTIRRFSIAFNQVMVSVGENAEERKFRKMSSEERMNSTKFDGFILLEGKHAGQWQEWQVPLYESNSGSKY